MAAPFVLQAHHNKYTDITVLPIDTLVLFGGVYLLDQNDHLFIWLLTSASQ